jgi:hypothetical protein
MNKKELWMKLKDYHFNHLVPANMWSHIVEVFGGTDTSTKAFADKISRKHNWKKSFTLKAISEYKKFVYLAVVSDFNVTPSKIIDVVWHEHLLFTYPYRKFCTDVIEYTLDHHPELVAMEEQTGRYSVQYQDTIDLYKSEFSVNPPADIWGETKYSENELIIKAYKSGEKKRINSVAGSSNSYSEDTALYTYFDPAGAIDEAYPEFNGFGGGDMGGAGASGDWDNSDSASDTGGDSGGDGGGGCSGGCGGGGD